VDGMTMLAYADDLVLLPLSWRAMHIPLSAAKAAANHTDMTINTKKTVVMVFSSCKRSLCDAVVFPSFVLVVAH
jgi:hypothetical protein